MLLHNKFLPAQSPGCCAVDAQDGAGYRGGGTSRHPLPHCTEQLALLQLQCAPYVHVSDEAGMDGHSLSLASGAEKCQWGSPETILQHPAESLSKGIPPPAGTGRRIPHVSSAFARGTEALLCSAQKRLRESKISEKYPHAGFDKCANWSRYGMQMYVNTHEIIQSLLHNVTLQPQRL